VPFATTYCLRRYCRSPSLILCIVFLSNSTSNVSSSSANLTEVRYISSTTLLGSLMVSVLATKLGLVVIGNATISTITTLARLFAQSLGVPFFGRGVGGVSLWGHYVTFAPFFWFCTITMRNRWGRSSIAASTPPNISKLQNIR